MNKRSEKHLKQNRVASQSLEEQKRLAEAYRAKARMRSAIVKSSLSSFLTTGLFVVAMVTVFIATLAWFANNEQLDGRGSAVNAEVNLLEAGNYDIYKASSEYGAPFEKYSFSDENESTLQGIKLNAYDAVLDTNPYTSIYFRIPVYSKELNDDNVTGINFTIDCDSDAYWINSKEATDGKLPYLSSIIQLKCYAFPDIDQNVPADNEAEYFYTHLKTEFEKVSDLKNYVNGEADPPVYATKQLSYFIPRYNNTDKTGYVAEQREDGLYQTYVYIEMDYSPKLIAKYLGLNNSHIELGQQINIDSFLQDIILMKFSLQKTGNN